MGFLNGLYDDFLSLLFPRVCYACGKNLVRNEKLICTECYVLMARTNYHLQKGNPVEQLFWGRCRVEKGAAFSFYNRESRMRQLIHNLKYKGVREIGIELGCMYAYDLKQSGFFEGIDILLPVPLHPSKKKARGFNQSEMIAEGVARIAGLPVDTTSLQRVSKTATQTRRSRYDRWINVEGIFKTDNKAVIENKHILLVDDVITTGSTIESCTSELLRTEGVKVSVIALAVAII
ncbi:MAG TPA: ComF family protein [Bacteroidales bacterium]|nr:ComF family protein [Bacteroidales bacterium]